MMELMIAAGKAVAQLQLEHGLAVERVFTGSFMTSLDMAGGYISSALKVLRVGTVGLLLPYTFSRLSFISVSFELCFAFLSHSNMSKGLV